MRHKRSAVIPFVRFPQSAGHNAWGLPLLGALVLVTVGCGATHQVSRDGSNGYRTVTAAAADKDVRVHLRDGRTLKLNDLYVGADSTSGVTKWGNRRAVPTSSVRSVQIVHRGGGAALGGIFGGAMSLAWSVYASSLEENAVRGSFRFLSGVVIALPAALLGGIVGWIRGQRETYRFSSPPSEADSTKAVSRSHRPEPQRWTAAHP